MKKFGATANTDGSAGEEHHRWSVNRAGQQTQRRHGTYAFQSAHRDKESTFIGRAYNFVRHHCPTDKRHLYTTTARQRDNLKTGNVGQSNGSYKLLGRYRAVATPVTNNTKKDGLFRYQIEWAQQSKTYANVQISPSLEYALSATSSQRLFEDQFAIEGYTELRVPSPAGNTICRATELFNGRERYDWALMRDESGAQYVGQIIGFFKHLTPGYPTEEHYVAGAKRAGIHPDDAETKEEKEKRRKLLKEHARKIREEELRDDTIYVAFRPGAKTVGDPDDEASLSLTDQIITRFQLVLNARSIYFLPISSILKPLIVVRDFGANDSRTFLHILPQHKWSDVFRRWIEKNMDQEERAVIRELRNTQEPVGVDV